MGAAATKKYLKWTNGGMWVTDYSLQSIGTMR